LYDAFGTDSFDRLYVDAERNESIPRKTIGAQELFLDLLKERAETGRIYIMNIDHCNSHSSFIDKVEMSNLCQEITLPTKPIQHIDDPNGEIALCILSAINIGKIKSNDELEVLCDLSVRSLDELIDYQNYPVKAAEICTKSTSITWGRLYWSGTLSCQDGVKYEDPGAWKLVHDLSEHSSIILFRQP
jgi:ribonucleoside-diphosphate reductase alpha chain